MEGHGATDPVEAAFREGRATLPELELEREAFAAFLAERPDFDASLAADLYLACACARKLPGALAAFEARHGRVIHDVARRAARGGADGADLAQMVRERLFVGGGREGSPAKIALYSGRAPLSHWVRVLALRTVHNAGRKRTEAPAADDAVLLEAIEPRTAETSLMEARLRRAYKTAFESAFAALDPRERALLRMHVLEDLGIDEIARLTGAHRATVARRIAAARERLGKETRARITDNGVLTPAEVESALRLIDSQIDLSLRRVLGAPGDGE